MISDYATLKEAIFDRMAREDLTGKEDMFVAPVMADAATMLNIYVTEAVMTQTAIEGQNSIIVPTQFCGALAVYLGDKRCQRVTLREVQDGEIRYSFAVSRERIWFYPAASAGDILKLEYRGIIRDGQGGTTIDVDSFAQVFHRQEAVTDMTISYADNQGRYPLVLEEITGTVDALEGQYNAGERLIERFPNVFLYGSLQNAYEYIQDEDRAAYWRTRYQEQIEIARLQLTAAQYGGAPLRINPRNRSLFNGVR